MEYSKLISGDTDWPYVPRRAVGLRLALRQSLKSKGSIKLSDVFWAQTGFWSYRFICILPRSKKSRLILFDARGQRIDAKTVLVASSKILSGDNGEGIGKEAYPSGMEHAVFAAELPADCSDFYAYVKGAGATFITREAIEQLARERDLMMVNPGNDGLYREWAERDEASRSILLKERTQNKGPGEGDRPFFSVITPVFNTPIAFLRELFDSMRLQTYPNWEHILVNASPSNNELSAYLQTLDDERFRVIALEGNRGISENTIAGINQAKGDYIAFVDHDDVLDPCALGEYAAAIAKNPSIDMLYCDEDSISRDGKERFAPIFKPDFNKDLLLSRNHIIHMLAVSRRALDLVTIYDDSVSGAQDYDLSLKVSAVARDIVRIPRVLYHWRQHDSSTTHTEFGDEVDVDAFRPSMIALERYLLAQGISATVSPHENAWLYRVAYPQAKAGDVALIIDHRNSRATKELLEGLSSQRISLLREITIVGEDKDKYSGIDKAILDITKFVPTLPGERDAGIEEAIHNSSAEYILLVDGRVAFLPESDSIGTLRDIFAREDVGIASAKAMSADGLNVHAGLCIKSDGSIGYLNQGFVHGMGGGYNGCAECCCDYSAVDAACVAFRKADFEQVGGFSKSYKSRLARDIDFSFRIRQLGKVVMVNPDARVRYIPDPSMLELGASHLKEADDLDKLWDEWGEGYRQDVLANPNYSMDKSFFNLKI